MIRLLALLLALLPFPALAQDIYPALHDVTGVAADDVLNVRTEPSAGAPIIGTFAPFETDIEVVALSADGRWGRVNAGEQAGWTSMRFLARQPGQTAADWANGLAPTTLRCYGTEPFWDVVLQPDGTFAYTDPFRRDGTPMAGRYTPLASASSTNKRGFFAVADAFPAWFSGILTFEICSDGMSDQDYGISLDLAQGDPTGGFVAHGCCRLVR